MKKNIHPAERLIRVVVGALLVSMAFLGPKNPWYFLGVIPLLTGFVGWCPPYALLGISTCRKVAVILMTLALNPIEPARADVPLVQVPIVDAYLPPHGYDDNDNIQVMLNVQLPDPCYTFDSAKFTLEGQKINIVAMGWRRYDGACSGGELLEPSNITTVMSLGRLDKGEYEIQVKTPEGGTGKKSFEVAAAKATTIDDLNYAQVTNIMINEFYAPTETIKAKLMGRYNPSCEKVVSEVKFWVDGDAVVSIPTVTKIEGRSCAQGVMEQYTRSFVIGKLKPGTYLIHARSKGGTSYNRLITVVTLQP